MAAPFRANPRKFTSEIYAAVDAARKSGPSDHIWHGEIRLQETHDRNRITCGSIFNLIDDSDPNDPKTLSQFRILGMVAAPEGYTNVIAVSTTAVPTQCPIIYSSYVIKSEWIYRPGVMNSMPSGTGLTDF